MAVLMGPERVLPSSEDERPRDGALMPVAAVWGEEGGEMELDGEEEQEEEENSGGYYYQPLNQEPDGINAVAQPDEGEEEEERGEEPSHAEQVQQVQHRIEVRTNQWWCHLPSKYLIKNRPWLSKMEEVWISHVISIPNNLLTHLSHLQVMGLHLPQAPPPESDEENEPEEAAAERSHASIPMDAGQTSTCPSLFLHLSVSTSIHPHLDLSFSPLPSLPVYLHLSIKAVTWQRETFVWFINVDTFSPSDVAAKPSNRSFVTVCDVTSCAVDLIMSWNIYQEYTSQFGLWGGILKCYNCTMKMFILEWHHFLFLADHVELVKRTMAAVALPSLSVPAWAEEISEDQWKDVVQHALQSRQNAAALRLNRLNNMNWPWIIISCTVKRIHHKKNKTHMWLKTSERWSCDCLNFQFICCVSSFITRWEHFKTFTNCFL